jgi:hypothetical protein
LKYSNWTQGIRAIREIELPTISKPAPGAGEVPELNDTAKPPKVGVRVLNPGEVVAVLEFAQDFAGEHRVKEPKPGNPLYDYGIALKTVEIGCVDPDSDRRRPESFFDGGIEQILSSNDLGQDGVQYLAEVQRRWQALCAPQASELSKEQVEEAVEILAGDKGLDFFERCGPALQWNLVRSMASLLLSLQTLKLWSSLNSGADTTSTSEMPSTNSDEAVAENGD